MWKWFSLVSILSSIALAADLTGYPPRSVAEPGQEITVGEYHKDIDVFEYVANDMPEAGPNYVATDALKKAIGDSSTKDEFVRRMLRDKTAVYVLKNKMSQLWSKEVEEMRAKLKKKDAKPQKQPKKTKK